MSSTAPTPLTPRPGDRPGGFAGDHASAGGAFNGLLGWSLAFAALRLLSPLWPDDALAARGGFMLAFAALAVAVVLGALGAARASVPGRLVALSLAPAAVLAAVVILGDVPPPLNALLLGALALTEGLWVGTSLGRGVTKPAHLWPLVVVAVGADLWSVTSPQGLTHQVVTTSIEQPDAWWLQLVVLHLPSPGVGLAPLLGVGDVLFAGLLAGAVGHLGLSAMRLALGLLLGFGLTLATLLIFAVPVPALVFIAPCAVAALGGSVRPSVREMALAIGVVVVLFGVQLALR